MSALSQSRSTSNITRMRQLFEGGTTTGQNQPIPLSRCRSEVITTRGFKPSDIKDPAKTQILQDLTYKIWGRNMETATATSGIHNGVAKAIDLQKLFTPAADAEEIMPKNKKMFASSSFYGPNHPTMEEQVELARRISSSLSDISNKESKGQSMYVNRKKRSVKWVHQGEEKQSLSEYSEVSQSENLPPTPKITEKPVLKLVMNPRGQVQDFNSLRHHGVDSTPSPEVCFDLVKDLNSPCGKGAELFAKRRKKAEKWVVDESNVKSSQEITSMSSYESYSSHTSSHTSNQQLPHIGKLATPALPTNLANLPTPSYLKDVPPRFAPTAAKNPIPDKYTQPKVRLIKSPWEAALEGSVESAFQDSRPAPSPTPRGHVLIAPSPSALSKMATPPVPQPQTPSAEMYTSKPPKAWHPQPTAKQLSSVKLDQIFAGSSKSPVSLAYHADTNTLSTEPIIVENIPPIAVKLYDYEIIDPSILREPKTRRPDQILAEVEPRKESPSGGAKWPPADYQEHELPGTVIWSPTAANWAKQSQPAIKRPPQQFQTSNFPPQIAQIPSPSQQKVTWPPLPQYMEDSTPTEEKLPEQMPLPAQQTWQPPHIPQPESTSHISQQAVQTVQQAVQHAQQIHQEQPLPVTESNVQKQPQSIVSWPPPQPETLFQENLQPIQPLTIQEPMIQNTLQQSLSEIQTAMSQACQNFTRVESSELSKNIQNVQSTQNDSLLQSQQGTSNKEIKKDDLFRAQEQSLSEMKIVSETSMQSMETKEVKSFVSEETVQSSDNVQLANIGKQFEQVTMELSETAQRSEEIKVESNTSDSTQKLDVGSSSSRKGSFHDVQSNVPAKEAAMQTNLPTIQQQSEQPQAQSMFSDKSSFNNDNSQAAFEELIANVIKTDADSLHGIGQTNGTDKHVQPTLNSSLKNDKLISSSEHVSSQSISTVSESFSEQKQMTSTSSSTGQFLGAQSTNSIKSVGFENIVRNPGYGGLQNINLPGKTEYRAVHQQEGQLSQTASRTSMSVMSTTDEEVRDLCEREFNQISMQYENMVQPDIKKPAAIIPGAVKIFPPGIDAKLKSITESNVSNHQNESSVNSVKEVGRKPYKKPPSMVPGAKPLFGEAIELHLGPAESAEGDRPYEKIPVKNLIKTFEESTRPHMKCTMKVPDTSHFTNVLPEQEMMQQSQDVAETQENQRNSLYDTYPTEYIPNNQGSDIKSQAPSMPTPEWTEIQVPSSNLSKQQAATSSIHVDLSNVNNFNTAPRGWQSNMSYYRPVTFSAETANQYTDF